MRIVKYLGFGALQFLLDFLLFLGLQTLGLGVLLANVISRLSAAIVGYYLNKNYTFAVGEVKTYAMVRRYWFFWLFMTALSSLLVFAWDRLLQNFLPNGVGKFLIECCLAVFGYLISKFWVYKNDR